MLNKLVGLLGLCHRSGRLCIGFDATAAAIKKRTARLVLLSEDLSLKTAKELRFLAEQTGCPLVSLPLTKEACGKALGRQKAVGALGVIDSGFAEALLRQINQKEETI